MRRLTHQINKDLTRLLEWTGGVDPKVSSFGSFDPRYTFGVGSRTRCIYTVGEWFDMSGMNHQNLLDTAKKRGLLLDGESDDPAGWPFVWIMHHDSEDYLTLRAEIGNDDGLTEVAWALTKFVKYISYAIVEWFPTDYEGGGPECAELTTRQQIREFIAKAKQR